MTSNTGLPSAPREQSLDPSMVNHVDEITLDVRDPTASINPGYIDASLLVIEVDEKLGLSSA